MDTDASSLACISQRAWKDRRTAIRIFLLLVCNVHFLMSTVDAGLSPRIRQLIAQHRASLVSLRVQLELLPDIAAELQEYASEHNVCEQ